MNARSWSLCILIAACGGGASRNAAEDRTLVVTDNGALRGVAEEGVRVWRGIPFAAPPAGNLRWRLPQPAASWTGARDASAFQAMCPQRRPGRVIGDEDCLYLNVYAPETEDNDLPVVIWVHGGSRVRGDGRVHAHDLARQGVIVVSIQYRLGSLGYLGYPGLTAESGTSGNWGFYDAVAALDWVAANIDRFGGDPHRITLLGQSSGASLVNILLASPLVRDRIQGAILMSNTVEPGDTHGLAESEATGTSLAPQLQCAGTDAQQVACLRSAKAASIVQAPFQSPPMLYAIDDGRLLHGDVALTLKKQGAGVPMMIGSTHDEISVFLDVTPPITEDQFVAVVRADFPTVADRILPLYPVAAYASPLMALYAVESDAGVTCHVRRLAQVLSQAPDAAPVYRYFFTHVLENDAAQAVLGAYHAEDLLFVFGDFNLFGAYAPTAAELRLAGRMQKLWARFAAETNPGWLAFTVANDNYLQLDDEIALKSGYHTVACDIFTPPY